MASKRERAPNWSIQEITILQELVKKEEDILKSKQTNTVTNNLKNAKWAEITSQINALGLQKRTPDQVKYKWGNLQQNAKKVFCEQKKQRKMTGGGQAPKPPTNVEEKIISDEVRLCVDSAKAYSILEMMKDRPNFSGIVGSFESSMPPVFEISLVEKAKNMHKEIKEYLENDSQTAYKLPRANDVHLIPFLEPSGDDDSSENHTDDFVNYLCSKYPRLQDISSQDVASLVHNTVQFIKNYTQGGTPNSSFSTKGNENSNSQVGQVQSLDVFNVSVVDTGSADNDMESSTSTSSSSDDPVSCPSTSSSTSEISRIQRITISKKKRVTLNDLQTIQYEVLVRQKKTDRIAK